MRHQQPVQVQIVARMLIGGLKLPVQARLCTGPAQAYTVDGSGIIDGKLTRTSAQRTRVVQSKYLFDASSLTSSLTCSDRVFQLATSGQASALRLASSALTLISNCVPGMLSHQRESAVCCRRDYEVLLRKLLSFDRQPAVIALYWYMRDARSFVDTAQDEMDILARCAADLQLANLASAATLASAGGHFALSLQDRHRERAPVTSA